MFAFWDSTIFPGHESVFGCSKLTPSEEAKRAEKQAVMDAEESDEESDKEDKEEQEEQEESDHNEGSSDGNRLVSGGSGEWDGEAENSDV